ncbi:hypothetical protein DSO57_1005590 [Entomophthora muscae]|uniref:Uncharacterized protein n=1 Tax=Entomophthora muscae TaxID=34485 RepID=A0ACC2UU57_9FUNG|nr:hypothetical protein DSO57_1005590 [Entomophthora muscae]
MDLNKGLPDSGNILQLRAAVKEGAACSQDPLPAVTQCWGPGSKTDPIKDLIWSQAQKGLGNPAAHIKRPHKERRLGWAFRAHLSGGDCHWGS